MYTVLFILTSESVTEYFIKYARNEEQAESINYQSNEFVSVTKTIFPGCLSEEKAIELWLD